MTCCSHCAGHLFRLLHEAGLMLVHFRTAPFRNARGCHQVLTSTGYPCFLGRTCHMFTFARDKFIHTTAAYNSTHPA